MAQSLQGFHRLGLWMGSVVARLWVYQDFVSWGDALIDYRMKLNVECSEIVEGYRPRNRFGALETQSGVIERLCGDLK